MTTHVVHEMTLDQVTRLTASLSPDEIRDLSKLLDFANAEIDRLREEVERLTRERDDWRAKYEATLPRSRDGETADTRSNRNG